MRDLSPEESYVDGVVAYREYRDELGLTQAEAREHPDTLEVFDDLTEIVATADELRMAYIGVIRSRGTKKQSAIEAVRTIEHDINTHLYHFTGSISERQFKKTREALETKEGVTKVAQSFVKLFKKVIPPEELPKARTKKASKPTTQPAQKEKKPEVIATQDIRFTVSRDAKTDAVIINDRSPELNKDAASLLEALVSLAEIDQELYIRPDALQNSTAWQRRVWTARSEGTQLPKFSDAMKSLRDDLASHGLANFIEAEGTGRGRMYRARVHRFAYPEETASEKSHTEHTITVRRETDARPETKEEQALRFAGKLALYIEGIIPDKTRGRRISEVRKSIMRSLHLSEDDSREVVRNFIRSIDLHVIDNEKGVRIVSTEAKADVDMKQKQDTQETAKNPEPVFKDKEIDLVLDLLQQLTKLDVLKGIKLKSLWVENPELETEVRQTISKLIQHGTIERFTPRLQSAAHSRRNTDPFVRFANAGIWRAAKRDLEPIVSELRALMN